MNSILQRVEQPRAEAPCAHKARAEGVCLGCGDGLDGADQAAVRSALAAQAAWLSEAGKVLAQLARVPSDPRYGPAVKRLNARQAVYRRLVQRARELAEVGPGIRYGFDVRWSREKGWLEVRDVFTGEWLQINAQDAPDHWRWRATEDAKKRRAARRVA